MKILPQNLSIRSKIIIIVLISAISLAAIISVVSAKILFKSYLNIENEEVARNLERANDALENTIVQLNIKLKDWASWDDTYEFVIDNNEDYIESNLRNNAIANLKMNTMVFVNTGKEIVFRKTIELDNNEEISSESVASYVESHDILMDPPEGEDVVGGVIPLPEGPFLIVSQPILNSDAEGPTHGALIFGKFLDDEVADAIADLTHLSVELFSYNGDSLPSDVLEAKNELLKGEEHYIQALSSDSIAAYKIVYDLDDVPILIMRIDTLRPIYQQGLITLYLFTAIASVSILIFGMIILLLLNTFLVSRLSGLEKDVAHISDTHDTSLQVKEGTQDEIGRLAGAINRMLSELVSSEKAEREARKKALAAGENLQTKLTEIEKMNALMVDREVKMIELKKRITELEGTGGAQLPTRP